MANGFKELKPFRYWCAKVLPLVYDDSLSYYELLGKVIESLNLTMEDVDLLNEYFDGIEVQEEIENTLDTMAQDGRLAAVMQPYINAQLNPVIASVPSYVSKWLEDNITGGDIVIDESFTTNGAAADAFKTGDMFRRSNSFDLLDTITQTDAVFNGIAYTWDGTNRCSVAGTATANSYSVLFSETGKLIGFPYPCYPGDVLQFSLESTDDNIYVHVFYYIGGEWVVGPYFNSNLSTVVPTNADGMLVRIEVGVGATVSGSIKVHAYNVVTNKALQSGFPVLLPSVYDCDGAINRLLTVYGGVQLCKGTYYINSMINMPSGSVIRGLGVGTIMQVRGGVETAIKMGSSCVLENFWLKGSGADSIPDDASIQGIFIDGNYGNLYVYMPKINKMTISNFAGSGIHITRTGGAPLNSPTVTDCLIFWCFNGILCNYGGEYARVIGCSITKCFHGVDNSSGNNKFIGCDFSENTNALTCNPQNKPEGYTTNNGHSTFSGCSFNHNNSNTGYAFIIADLSNGLIFDGCQIWYGKIWCTDNESPVVFNACQFRGTGDTSFYLDGNSNVLANACLFASAPVNAIESGSALIYNQCYLNDMTPLT